MLPAVIRCSLLAMIGCAAFAQDGSSSEIWPEARVFLQLNDRTGLYFLAAWVDPTSEAEFTEGQSGVHFDVLLRRGTREWVLRAGYRLVKTESEDEAVIENRPLVELEGTWALLRGWSVQSRTRMEFRFIGGDYAWRFRVRGRAEKEVMLGRYRLSPFGTTELFYDSQAHAWNRLQFTAGLSIPLGKHFGFELYYARQQQISTQPPDVNAAGLRLNVYIRN